MSDMTNYLEAALMNHTFRNSAYSSPTTVYLALFTTATADDGTGTEVTGGSYARQPVAFAAGSQVNGAYQIANSADVEFPIATANWGTVTHAAMFDALSGGNMLIHGALTTSRTVNTNDQIKFSAGDLKLSLT